MHVELDSAGSARVTHLSSATCSLGDLPSRIGLRISPEQAERASAMSPRRTTVVSYRRHSVLRDSPVLSSAGQPLSLTFLIFSVSNVTPAAGMNPPFRSTPPIEYGGSLRISCLVTISGKLPSA